MKNKIITWTLIILTVMCVLAFWMKYLNTDVIKVTVSGINKGDYVSLCEIDKPKDSGCDQYINIDDWWWLKVDSGTVQARLESASIDREVVTVRVQGFRLKWFSVRKNIIKVIE